MTTVGEDAAVLVDLARIETGHSAAALAWLLYDILLSFDEEVKLIWRSADTLPKLLYFISRYLGLFIQIFVCFRITPLYCKPATVFNVISFSVLTFSVEISLMLRVYALYGRSRSVLYILCGSLGGELLSLAIIDGISYQDFFPKITPYPASWPVKGCYYPRAPAVYSAGWIPVLAFETILFVLMTIKCYSYRPVREVPILLRVWRDGTAYYFVILVALILCTVAPFTASVFLSNMAVVWITAIYSYSGANLLLSVRALAAERRRLEVPTPLISEDIPDIGTTESVPDSPMLPSPLEVHELLPRGMIHARHVVRDVASLESAVPYSTSTLGWIEEWDT